MRIRTKTTLGALALLASSHALAALQFTDWTSASATAAAGTVGSITVTLTGTQINPSNVSGNGTVFNQPSVFTPALPLSDVLELSGLATPSTFTLSFSAPVVDPIFHLADLSSTLTFSAGSVVKVSGSSSLTASGNQVPCDGLGGSSACQGTVMLSGIYSTITFTALNSAGGDGFFFQLGFDPLAPIPEPSTWALLLVGLGAVAARARRSA